jgi:hypothetical protein
MGQEANQEQLGHFDEFGTFKYHLKEEPAQRQMIDLKDLTEKNFNDLLGAKNQDKRFYSWLHFHPLFDDDTWEDEARMY